MRGVPCPRQAAQLGIIDMRTADDGKLYYISILENYSRAILASALSRRQDLSARVPSGWHDGALRDDPSARRAGRVGQR